MKDGFDAQSQAYILEQLMPQSDFYENLVKHKGCSTKKLGHAEVVDMLQMFRNHRIYHNISYPKRLRIANFMRRNMDYCKAAARLSARDVRQGKAKRSKVVTPIASKLIIRDQELPISRDRSQMEKLVSLIERLEGELKAREVDESSDDS